MVADRQSRNKLTGIGIHHCHYLAPATDEQTAIRTINRHAGRRLTRRGRPALLDFEVARVNSYYQALIFQIVEDVTLAIGSSELRASAEIDGSCYFSARRLDCGGAVAIAIEGENARSRRIVNDPVGSLARRHMTDGLERFQVENGDRGRPAIAHKPSSRLGRDRDAVKSRRG